MAPTQSARRHSRAQRKSSNYHGEVSRPFNKSKSAVAAIDKVETYADNMCGNTRKCFSGSLNRTISVDTGLIPAPDFGTIELSDGPSEVSNDVDISSEPSVKSDALCRQVHPSLDTSTHDDSCNLSYSTGESSHGNSIFDNLSINGCPSTASSSNLDIRIEAIVVSNPRHDVALDVLGIGGWIDDNAFGGGSDNDDDSDLCFSQTAQDTSENEPSCKISHDWTNQSPIFVAM